MKTWNEHLEAYERALATGDRAIAWKVLADAQRLPGDRTQRKWLHRALKDDDGRWFVAAVFERQPVPRALLSPMLQAALREPVDASSIKSFIVPLVETFGQGLISSHLDAMVEARPTLATAVDKARYWLNHVKKCRHSQ